MIEFQNNWIDYSEKISKPVSVYQTNQFIKYKRNNSTIRFSR